MRKHVGRSVLTRRSEVLLHLLGAAILAIVGLVFSLGLGWFIGAVAASSVTIAVILRVSGTPTALR